MRLSRSATAVVCVVATACTSWQQRNPSQLDGLHPVRLELADSSRVLFDRASLRGDSIHGVAGRPPQETAVPLANVRRVEEHRVSAARTAGLVVGSAAGLFVGGVVLLLSLLAQAD